MVQISLWFLFILIILFDLRIHAIRKNTEALITASKETGLGVNAEKTKYMIMPRDQDAWQNSNTQIRNKYFQTLE